MADGEACELLFLEVPPPGSGNVVEFLKEHSPIVQAAAVYSGIDVVAVLKGNVSDLDSVAGVLLATDETPVKRVERFRVDIVEDGPQAISRESWIRGACQAFVRCSLRPEEASLGFITHSLSKLPGVVRAYASSDSGEIVLEVVGYDKAQLDDSIMKGIQTCAGFVRSTRTHIVINSMHWRRVGLALDHAPSIFLCLSSKDLQTGESLARRITEAVGIRVWIFTEVPVASEFWREHTLSALRQADMQILLLSPAFQESNECQREFGNIEAQKTATSVLGLVLPGVQVSDLEPVFRNRQLVLGEDMLAFSHVTRWISERLRGEVQGG